MFSCLFVYIEKSVYILRVKRAESDGRWGVSGRNVGVMVREGRCVKV